MTTFAQLVDDVLLSMSGYSTQQDQATYLTASLSASATTASVADTSAVSRGLVEIDSELIWVDSVDSSALTLTIPPYGRGFRSTTAAAHASGTRVVSAPLIPRDKAKRAVNEAIRSVYPDLFGVAATTLTASGSVSTFALPAGAKGVLAVNAQTVGPSLEWLPVRRWRLDTMADTTSFASGSSISIYDPVTPGKSIRVTYTKEPTELSADADVFTTVTGLPESCVDVIRLGACVRLVPFLDIPHLQGASAEANYAANARPQQGATAVARFLTQTYQLRLQEEAAGLQSVYPVRSHYTR